MFIIYYFLNRFIYTNEQLLCLQFFFEFVSISEDNYNVFILLFF